MEAAVTVLAAFLAIATSLVFASAVLFAICFWTVALAERVWRLLSAVIFAERAAPRGFEVIVPGKKAAPARLMPATVVGHGAGLENGGRGRQGVVC